MASKVARKPAWAASVHLCREIELKRPFWRYFEVYGEQGHAFFLDSAGGPEALARYSFMGGDPYAVFKAWRADGMSSGSAGVMEITAYKGKDGRPVAEPRGTRFRGDPFGELGGLIRANRPELERGPGEPVPFLGGAVGYIGYEAGGFIEDLPGRAADEHGLPDMCFLFVDTVLAHCHRSGRSYVSAVGRGTDRESAGRRAEEQIEAVRAQIRAFEEQTRKPRESRANVEMDASCDVRACFDERGYGRLVEAARERIFAGDAFEVCLSQRLEAPFEGDTWELYGELRRINPAPFACLLKFPEVEVLSSSPERFLRLSPGGKAESRPIKGTRPRGKTREEDARLRRALRDSEKDRAENVMIVDLVRNDFGRVCKFHTVRVAELMAIEAYATVFQMVSTIRGELAEGRDGLDLVRACFPGGSMTGAPKIEAMKIIDRLEPVKRGVYSGAIGYLDYSGTLDLNIVIRTMMVREGRCWIHTGGAVVADSDAAEEYAETMHKAAALIRALGNVRGSRDAVCSTS